MCGIAGQLNWTAPPDRDLVARMTRALAHRGPDGECVTVFGPAALGHRRLAIIDLSQAAAQPMSDVSGGIAIAYNGEIYNYRELKKELEALGARFRSQSDTEVILEAYKHWGHDCFARFNGMFALALWDGRAQTLLMARDRLGKKPLYFRVASNGSVTFASELQALAQDSALDRTVNPRALSQFLSLNYTLTSDAMLQGVRKLRPGCVLTCEAGKEPRETSYWDLASCFATRSPYRTVEASSEALRALVDDAVRLRLVSDVPLGVFLSGGVDSATIAASMCQSIPAGSVRSFSMGFEERSFSELDEARATARLLGIDHRDLETHADVAAVLPRILSHADEPFADTSTIPVFLLSEFARRHVTVCLAGDGGDEVFAGYETYVADKLHRWSSPVPAPLMRGATSLAHALMPVSFDKVSFDYKARQFLSAHELSPARAHYHWRTIFSDDEKLDLLRPELRPQVAAHDPGEAFEAFDRDVAFADSLSRGQYVDIKTWLVDDILVKADRASMAHGLEIRAPFLDYRIVEFAAGLPAEWKLNGLTKKYVLKVSQKSRLPASILDRKKQGFNAPVAHWLLTSFRSAFETITTDAAASEWFNVPFVRELWSDHLNRRRDNSHKLLGLIALQLWIRTHHAQPFQ